FNRAKEAAIQFLKINPSLNDIILLNNDYLQLSNILTNEEAVEAISNLGISSQSFSMNKIIQQLKVHNKSKDNHYYNIHIFSDLPADAFQNEKHNNDLNNCKFYITDVFPNEIFQNIYLDSVYFLNPYIDPQQPNKLLVKTKYISQESLADNYDLNIQLLLNNQVVAISKVNFEQHTSVVDTFDLQIKSG